MYAFKGDQILVPDRRTANVRHAVVLSGDHADGHPPYWVRWTDSGEEGVWIPSSGAEVEHAGPTYPAEYEPEQ